MCCKYHHRRNDWRYTCRRRCLTLHRRPALRAAWCSVASTACLDRTCGPSTRAGPRGVRPLVVLTPGACRPVPAAVSPNLIVLTPGACRPVPAAVSRSHPGAPSAWRGCPPLRLDPGLAAVEGVGRQVPLLRSTRGAALSPDAITAILAPVHSDKWFIPGTGPPIDSLLSARAVAWPFCVRRRGRRLHCALGPGPACRHRHLATQRSRNGPSATLCGARKSHQAAPSALLDRGP
jgi:hypothetical protein